MTAKEQAVLGAHRGGTLAHKVVGFLAEGTLPTCLPPVPAPVCRQRPSADVPTWSRRAHSPSPVQALQRGAGRALWGGLSHSVTHRGLQTDDNSVRKEETRVQGTMG